MATARRWPLLSRVGLLAVATWHGAGATTAGCSNFNAYLNWVEDWREQCRLSTDGNVTATYDASCSWVTCECLWGVLDAPVPTDELAPCFEQALQPIRVSDQAQQFVRALMHTCRGHTEALAQPCGQCDRYRQVRNECPSGVGI
eukprot:CAMPEP_0178381064 /NCGR_PEP_ID=MMETSP0689_2-20121128/5789_1 /TAXON_ID=160604 /ORGANISM="Amphidinium massartii, Strain CS-259" /LENGTH=143 /DNA_ID=CAMNT_0020001233 /DNA_START=9 /DNA_END=440 /DNA_ORIENTATION=+